MLFAHRPGGLVLGQAVRRRPDAAHASTSSWSARPGSSTPSWSARALRPLPPRRATSGRTRTTTRASPSTRRPASRASSTSRTSPRALAQIGSGSDATSSPSSTAPTPSYYEVTVESEWRDGKTLRARLVHLEPLLRQLRPGQLDASTTTPTSSSARRTSRDGAGRQLWDFKDGDLRGDRPHLLKVYGYRHAAVERHRRRLRVCQSGQPWETWSFEPYRALTTSPATPTATPSRRARAAPPSHYQLDLNYTQNFQRRRPRRPSSSTATCSTSSTSRPATTSSRGRCNSAFGDAAAVLRPAAHPAGGAVPVLTATFASGARRRRAGPSSFRAPRTAARARSAGAWSRRRARVPRRCAPRASGSLQQHAHLRALEERHAGTRDAAAGRDRARRAPPASRRAAR